MQQKSALIVNLIPERIRASEIIEGALIERGLKKLPGRIQSVDFRFALLRTMRAKRHSLREKKKTKESEVASWHGSALG